MSPAARKPVGAPKPRASKPRASKPPAGGQPLPAAAVGEPGLSKDPPTLPAVELPARVGTAGILGTNDGNPPPTPLRIHRTADLQTGLSDYATWMEMFSGRPTEPAPPGSIRRGRIWA